MAIDFNGTENWIFEERKALFSSALLEVCPRAVVPSVHVSSQVEAVGFAPQAAKREIEECVQPKHHVVHHPLREGREPKQVNHSEDGHWVHEEHQRHGLRQRPEHDGVLKEGKEHVLLKDLHRGEVGLENAVDVLLRPLHALRHLGVVLALVAHLVWLESHGFLEEPGRGKAGHVRLHQLQVGGLEVAACEGLVHGLVQARDVPQHRPKPPK
mmetsp:Transcript_13405/g.28328  ORF Transcript_13405/g.28328 Transcript_13405/m.28328 type:complete len:212 (-) Transcript_13405:70-705(-)